MSEKSKFYIPLTSCLTTLRRGQAPVEGVLRVLPLRDLPYMVSPFLYKATEILNMESVTGSELVNAFKRRSSWELGVLGPALDFIFPVKGHRRPGESRKNAASARLVLA